MDEPTTPTLDRRDPATDAHASHVRGSTTAGPLPRLAIAAAVALALTTAVFATLWLSARSEKVGSPTQAATAPTTAETAPQVADLRNVLDSIDAGRLDIYDVDSDRSAEESAFADVLMRGDSESLEITVNYPSDAVDEWLAQLLDELGFPTATQARMERTRAIDGTLEATGAAVTATWTYHPDSGLQIIVERDA